MLALSRHTGMLRVGDSTPDWAVIADGELVVAGSSTGPRIHSAVVARGLLTAEEVSAAGIDQSVGDLRALPTLVDLLGAVKLYPLVREQTVGTVFQLLLPSAAAFEFRPGDAHPLAEHFRFPVDVITEEASRRVGEWREVLTAIPSTDTVFRISRRLSPDLPSVTLTREEWAVVSILDGRRSVAQAIAASGRSAFEVCSILHRLLTTGLVERSG
jgi:hypothetical protein